MVPPQTNDTRAWLRLKLDGSVALVTGANRGLGLACAQELLARGTSKVYGAASDPDSVTEPDVIPVALDVTDPERVAEVAAQCADVSVLVNNAGAIKASSFIDAPNLEAARVEMETNYFGTLSMCRALAPVLAARRHRRSRGLSNPTLATAAVPAIRGTPGALFRDGAS
jgi:NAD(P)-dependent dehydrogenase (short-subunit alcohol dehydrogenase family)